MQASIRGTILYKDPIIIQTETFAKSPYIGDAAAIASLLNNKPASILIVPAATWLGRDFEGEGISQIRGITDSNPRLELYFLCNEEAEKDFLSRLDLRAYVINQNAFVDDNLYSIAHENKIFDAVYNAQMLPFKRHHLAASISRLALIYYGSSRDYFYKVRDALPHAFYANGDPAKPEEGGGNLFRWIPHGEIGKIYSQAHVGLCLSAREGAMYACAEYLLSGLPVVSTHNVGGRNMFLDSNNSLFCNDDPKAVASAVAEIISRDLSPTIIRENFLKKAHLHRDRFYDLVESILADKGHNHIDYREYFNNHVFRNRVWKSRTNPDNFILLPAPSLTND